MVQLFVWYSPELTLGILHRQSLVAPIYSSTLKLCPMASSKKDKKLFILGFSAVLHTDLSAMPQQMGEVLPALIRHALRD